MMAIKRRFLQPGERIRVLAIDDSVVIRRLVTMALEEDPAIEVVGVAANGSIALQRIPHLNPDVLILDVEMPEMNGIELLRQLRGKHPQIRVIMFSTLTERGAGVTLEALSLGADDYVTKASNEGSLDRSLARLRGELVPKIKQFFSFPVRESPPVPPELRRLVSAAQSAQFRRVPPRVVAIGVSTGGPTALAEVLQHLPARFPLPVLVVQHMPPVFTRLLAERLDAACALDVREGAAGAEIVPGRILIAPGDFHMRVSGPAGSPRLVLDQSPPLNSCRPAVDALLCSIAEVFGGAVIAVILTGMGRDGLRGCQVLKAHAATILAQDEATSVVWGMPGTVVEAGLADQVLPLDRIAGEIVGLASACGVVAKTCA